MPHFEDNSISTIAVHRIGNKTVGEPLLLSDAPLLPTQAQRSLLTQFFIEPFRAQEQYHLGENEELLNTISAIFDEPESLFTHSTHIAELLYDAATHPNIKTGDLFVVHFSECLAEGVATSAIGLFKAESQTEFIKVINDGTGHFALDVDAGFDSHKLDKGAIIFNLEADKGYIVNVVDATNRGSDASYWRDAFLGLHQRHDEFYNTHAEMSAYRSFVTEELPRQFEGVSKADQADLLNKSVNYFKQNDSFDLDSFGSEVIGQPEVIDSFKQYRTQYSEERGMELQDDFAISTEAVKKQSRSLRSVIKLDKNFHIYIHGDRQKIEQGEDERGKYYKVYYENES